MTLPTNDDAEEAKTRVRAELDRRESGGTDQTSSGTTTEADIDILRALSDQGDPIASALLGAAIWRELIDYQKAEGSLHVSLSEQGSEMGKNFSLRLSVC